MERLLRVSGFEVEAFSSAEEFLASTTSPVATGQEPQPPAAASPPAAAAGGISAEQIAKANNPLASMNALNFQNSWIPAIRGMPDAR